MKQKKCENCPAIIEYGFRPPRFCKRKECQEVYRKIKVARSTKWIKKNPSKVIIKYHTNETKMNPTGFYAQQLRKDEKKDWSERKNINIHGNEEVPTTAHSQNLSKRH